MSRPDSRSGALPGGAPAAGSRADACIRAAAGVTVVGLAGIAGAISYSHMRLLAAGHGETGWQAHAFPLSVDGIEIVASLVLLADRRTGRRSGWLPWAALVAGTTASLAANVAAAGAGPVGRVIAGWPAFALLVAVKLLSGMLEHRRSEDRPAGTRDHPVPITGRPLVPGGGGDDQGTPAGPVPSPGGTTANGTARTASMAGIRAVPHPITGNGLTSHPGTGTGAPPGHGPGTEPGDGEGPVTAASAGAGTAARTGTGAEPDIAALLPAARAARDHVLNRGSVLTRDTLAAQLFLQVAGPWRFGGRVEIGGKDNYKGRRREKDPKFALRHGFNLAGRLTQFLQPPSEEEPDSEDADAGVDEAQASKPRADPEAERLHSSWQDLWRQLGARSEPIQAPEAGLPATRFLAFHVVRQNQTRTWGTTRQVPLAVLMNHDGTHIQVKAPGIGGWLPLHQALLAIGRAHVMGGQTRTPKQVTDFFHEILTQDLDTSQPLLLLTAAQNTRPGWKFLNNSDLIADALRFGNRAPMPITDFPGLRHVRIRTDQRNETPEGYGVRDIEKGHAGALWHVSDRIWFSTADKPPTARNAVRYSSMVEPVEKPDGSIQPPRPGALVWNHQLIELAVAAIQEGDNVEAWAALTHDLRWAASHYSRPTTHPWPLHLAQLIGEYIVPVKMIEEIQNEADPEASADDDQAGP